MDPAVLATAHAVAARHHIPSDQIRPLPRGGANHVLALGPDLVLRIPRTVAFAADLRKEAALIPIAHRAGVRTPALVEFTDPPEQLPHLLIERAPGTDLAQTDEHEPTPRLLAQVGHQLALIHRIPTTDLPELPHETTRSDPAPLLKLLTRLKEQGHLDAATAHWLGSWCQHLATHLPATPAPTLVHGDLAPQNLLSDDTGDLCALIDWGDAALADPATDFAKLPPHWLPPVLDGYLHTHEEPAPRSWAARILWHHLTWALARLRDPAPHPGQRHWSAPPTSRILGLLRLFTHPLTAPWSELAPPDMRPAPGR